MALSEARIRWMWSEAHNDTSDRMAYQVLAAMVETEVRKDCEPLIRQMLASLEGYRRNLNDPQQCDAERAARAWLGEPT